MTARGWCWILALLSPMTMGPLWAWATASFAPQNLQPIGGLVGWIVVFTCLTASYTDSTERRIPNWATYSAALWGLLLGLVHSAVGEAGHNPQDFDHWPVGVLKFSSWFVANLGDVAADSLLDALSGFMACFLATVFVYSLSGGGAGDVKLAAALGALLGFARGLEAMVLAWAVAGAGILIWAILQYGPVYVFGSILRRIGSWIFPTMVMAPSDKQKDLLTRQIPLAVFYSLGTFGSLFGVFQGGLFVKN